MRARILFLVVSAASVTLGPAADVSAQPSFGWSPHFGASILPRRTPEEESIDFTLNLFTELAKELEGTDFRRYGTIQTTIGVQELGYTISGSKGPGEPVFWTFRGSVLRINDDVPSFLQNTFMHGLLGTSHVPRARRMIDQRVAVGVDVTRTTPAERLNMLNSWVSLGLSALGLLNEVYAQGGFQLNVGRFPDFGLQAPGVALSLSGRVGKTFDSERLPGPLRIPSYLRGHYSRHYALGQAQVIIDPAVIRRLVPALEAGGARVSLGYTASSGLFLNKIGEPRCEQFITLGVDLPLYALAVETWNDLVGDKDEGPTFGLKVIVRGW